MGGKSSPPGFSYAQQESTLHRFIYSSQQEQGSGLPWGGAGGSPRQGLMLHPWICTYELEKPHQALGISWEGRNNAELLGRIPAQVGRLHRKGAWSMEDGTG